MLATYSFFKDIHSVYTCTNQRELWLKIAHSWIDKLESELATKENREAGAHLKGLCNLAGDSEACAGVLSGVTASQESFLNMAWEQNTGGKKGEGGKSTPGVGVGKAMGCIRPFTIRTRAV
jgi:hypothetical protein